MPETAMARPEGLPTPPPDREEDHKITPTVEQYEADLYKKRAYLKENSRMLKFLQTQHAKQPLQVGDVILWGPSMHIAEDGKVETSWLKGLQGGPVVNPEDTFGFITSWYSHRHELHPWRGVLSHTTLVVKTGVDLDDVWVLESAGVHLMGDGPKNNWGDYWNGTMYHRFTDYLSPWYERSLEVVRPQTNWFTSLSLPTAPEDPSCALDTTAALQVTTKAAIVQDVKNILEKVIADVVAWYTPKQDLPGELHTGTPYNDPQLYNFLFNMMQVNTTNPVTEKFPQLPLIFSVRRSNKINDFFCSQLVAQAAWDMDKVFQDRLQQYIAEKGEEVVNIVPELMQLESPFKLRFSNITSHAGLGQRLEQFVSLPLKDDPLVLFHPNVASITDLTGEARDQVVDKINFVQPEFYRLAGNEKDVAQKCTVILNLAQLAQAKADLAKFSEDWKAGRYGQALLDALAVVANVGGPTAELVQILTNAYKELKEANPDPCVVTEAIAKTITEVEEFWKSYTTMTPHDFEIHVVAPLVMTAAQLVHENIVKNAEVGVGLWEAKRMLNTPPQTTAEPHFINQPQIPTQRDLQRMNTTFFGFIAPADYKPEMANTTMQWTYPDYSIQE